MVRSSYSGRGKWFSCLLNLPETLWSLKGPFPILRQRGCVGYRSTPSTAEVKNRRSCTSNPHIYIYIYIYLHGVDRNRITFSCFFTQLKLYATRLTTLHKYTALFYGYTSLSDKKETRQIYRPEENIRTQENSKRRVVRAHNMKCHL